MKVTEFIKQLQKAVNSKTLYVRAAIGSPMTPYMKERYLKGSYNSKPERAEKIKNCSNDTFGFDCSGLVKSILWGWDAKVNETYGGATYASNGVPDYNANTFISICKDVSTNFNTIVKGEFVWMDGHCGIYIGDGKVIECTPKWKDGVQITNLNGRGWVKHGKLPYVEYETNTIQVGVLGNTIDVTTTYNEITVKVPKGTDVNIKNKN
jgi:hypothetical protein